MRKSIGGGGLRLVLLLPAWRCWRVEKSSLVTRISMKSHPEVVVPVFIGAWIALGIAGLWVTYFDKNVARKKRLIPAFIVGTGAIFALFAFLMTGGDWGAMLLVVPAVVLITFLNLRQFRVCSTCGRTIHGGMWFAKAEFCPKCGARLE
ncbi:MAG: hypothetical protein WA423_16310 [Candidatus Sulfotelmatobacter sp.]